MASMSPTVLASSVTSLIVGHGGSVTEADQQAATLTITGSLNAALPAGDTVLVLLPSGVTRQASVAPGGTSFALTLTGPDTLTFGVPGQVSAYAVDPSGNQGAPFTQAFAAASPRTVAPATSTPTDFLSSGASALALSGDGKSVAFVAKQIVGGVVQFGLYVERLDTGTLTLVAAAGRAPSLSTDGHLIAYRATQGGVDQVFLRDLNTGTTTLLSATTGGQTSGPRAIADDGTVVFEGSADPSQGLLQQVYAVRVTGGSVALTVLSDPASGDGTPGNGTSQYATISADGSTAVFLSQATNLLSPGDPHAVALDGSYQVYARALRDNPVTGQRAGNVVLVSGNPDGSISNGSDYNPVVSGNGRFVVFERATDGQVHLADLSTGQQRIISTNALGAVADAGATGATISADGGTVVFQSSATNLLGASEAAPNLTGSQQVYAKNLVTGQVTLLSEGGYTPGDLASLDPTISADGTVAAFASGADNLVPGIAAAPNSASYVRGYVTTVATVVSLTLNAPAGPVSSTTVVLTGTIDHAHAAVPITLTDTADPGFLPVTATVTPGSDPYVDTWTATVIFTVAGAQTVTAAAGGTTAQAALSLLAAPALTIDPVNGEGTITATGTAGHTTAVSGTAPGDSGLAVALSLRTGGALLPLGSATVGADGRWSVAVADAALVVSGSGAYVLLAEIVDGAGQKVRASEAVTVTVPVPVIVYSYRFTYTDGSFYTGTVADDGRYGYAAGQTIVTSGGSYTILGAGGTTSEAAGTVTAGTYYDVSTSASYTPASASQGVAAGTDGLGSETDSTNGPGGVRAFGGGVTEARQSAATAFGYSFAYNDGSSYFGTVVGGASSGYYAGKTISSSNGTYRITGSDSATTAAIGTVTTSLYYDAASAQSYVPVLYSQGKSSGTQGLGSEADTVGALPGATKFGLGGGFQVALTLPVTYLFIFKYTDGSAYYGYVVDDGTYGYYTSQVIKGADGIYSINEVSQPFQLDGKTLTPGEVSVFLYYDSSSKQTYTPGYFLANDRAGSAGLGSEIDFTTGFSGDQYFGVGGTLEAKQVPHRLYDFTFTYQDGSYYTGVAIDDGTYGYFSGQTIMTPYGHYYISGSADTTVGEGLATGAVYTNRYLDITSGGPYPTLYGEHGQPTGAGGLGTENDAVLDPAGVYRSFGYGGRLEAKLTPNVLYRFEFSYKDGSSDEGEVVGDATHGPHVGDIITTDYGQYDLYEIAGASANAVGTVTLSYYFDISDQMSYLPHLFGNTSSFGTSGLGTEVGYVDGPLAFGFGGEYEARHAPDTVWNFVFNYNDGSYYQGQVVGNDQSGLYYSFAKPTAYGVYYVFDSVGATSAPAGTVKVSLYYDATSGKSYTPYEINKYDGIEGLGSEENATLGDRGLQGFGLGGLLEAKQSAIISFDFTFRYTDGSFYTGTVTANPSDHLNVGDVINEVGGYYNISGEVNGQSIGIAGSVQVSSYFDIVSGRFYTPVHYTEGKDSGASGLGSEADYIGGGSGLHGFGGSAHQEAKVVANTRVSTTDFFAFDGPLQGATVGYADPRALPGTLRIDPNQPTATTGADGGYLLAGGQGPLVLTGGTDTATRLPFKGALESVGTGSVLSPVTTLVEAVAVANGDTTLPGIARAEALVTTALGLPAGLDLTSYLPGQILRDRATQATDVPAAASVYRAGAKLLDAETLIDAAGGSSRAAIEGVARALAGGSVTDLAGLTTLIDFSGLAPKAETAVKAIIAATNVMLDQQLVGVTTPAAILTLISGASIALQGGAATALAAAAADDSAIANTYVQTLPMTLAADDRMAFDASVACYCRGTAILTTPGETMVEDLTIGMVLPTRDGRAAAIRWIGRRSYSGRFLAHSPGVRPICIRAGALGDAIPKRDLLVSPCHAMFIQGVLVPAAALVNGVSIVRAGPMQQVEYFHIELDTHDLIVAEGAWSESFVDDDSRGMFHNADQFCHVYPDHVRIPALYCAPRLEDGEQLEHIRQAVDGRAGITGARGFAAPIRL